MGEYTDPFGENQAAPPQTPENVTLPEWDGAVWLFDRILPKDGFRAGASVFSPKGAAKPQLYNLGYKTNEDMAIGLLELARNKDTWHATASYKELGLQRPNRHTYRIDRRAYNIHSRQCFHGDIDVGETKNYKLYDTAKQSLLSAINLLDLPKPIIIHSGHGLHFYMPLDEPIHDMALWKSYSLVIGPNLKNKGVILDDGCWADSVRLLRTPGTINHKSLPAPVAIDERGDGPVPLSTFNKLSSVYRSTIRKRGKDVPKWVEDVPEWLLHPSDEWLQVMESVRTEDYAYHKGSPLYPILKGCDQIRYFTQTGCQLDGEEPLRKACLGVLAFCENGEEAAHAWSARGPDYRPEHVQFKLNERKKLSGPTTCNHFATLGNNLCSGCVHRHSIITPCQLGDRYD
jgi:hypothetical protein